jgi:hypothetical protein
MKNKNETNYTVKQLTDKLCELCTARYPSDPTMKWAYMTGVLESILDFEVRGYNKGLRALQEAINEDYERYDQELSYELELQAARN